MVDLEQHRRVVRRTTRFGGLGALESERLQIQFIDEGIYNVHCVVLGDEVVQRLRKQRDLLPILAFDEPWHIDSRLRYAPELYAATSHRGPGFSHGCAGRPARSRWCKSTAMKE